MLRCSYVFPAPSASEYASFWHGYHGAIRLSDESQFDEILADLMDALDRGLLSDRSAGRLLHTLVRRRRQLHQERLNEQLIRLGEQHRAQLHRSGPRPASTSATGPLDRQSQEVKERTGLHAKKNATH